MGNSIPQTNGKTKNLTEGCCAEGCITDIRDVYGGEKREIGKNGGSF
jgi:hypothetical protein